MPFKPPVICALLAVALPLAAQSPAAPEALWYMRNDTMGIRSFAENAKHISVIAPQVYAIDSAGRIHGGADPRIIEIAKANKVKLVPLVMNPGFSLGILHHIVTNPKARTASARSLAALCRAERFHGIQLDFENLYVGDKDAFTAFARESADSVHRAGCELSAAVVPRTSDDRGTQSYHQYMYDYWRGAYDYKALAEALDFISYMTYAQHTGRTPPGPVAGYPWMVASIDYLLRLGIPKEKISLGIPSYSDYWYTRYDAAKNEARTAADDIPYVRLMGIIRAAGGKPVWNDEQKATNAVWEDHGVFEHAWIEDARAFEAKLGLVKQHGFRGYSVWVLGREDPKTWEIVGPVR